MRAIKHHPAPENLMSCSAGSMPDAFAAVMASHIVMCPQCQADLSFLETVGSVLFDTLNATPVTKHAPVIELFADEGRRGETPDKITSPLGALSDVPAPLATVIGQYLDVIEWRNAGHGVMLYEVTLPSAHLAAPRSQLRLIKVAPGEKLPAQSPTGSRLSLVLRGSCSDASDHFAAGDVAEFSTDPSQFPVAGQQGCICLVATEAP